MKYAIVAVAAIIGISVASAEAAPVAPAEVGKTVAVSEVQNVYYHNRWRSHRRWGSGGHNRWRSQHRWGSRGYFHNRWRSHRRWGSRRW